MLCWEVPSNRTRGKKTDAQEIPPEEKEELHYCAGDHTLGYIVQRACGLSLTGDIKELSGYNPVLCALG